MPDHKKRLSHSERVVKAKGGTDAKKYAAYKAAGGKLNTTQAARVGYKSPQQSKAAFSKANRSGEIGKAAGAGGIQKSKLSGGGKFKGAYGRD